MSEPIDSVQSDVQSWSARHFSLANPKGDCQDDLPRLLRSLADQIEQLGEIEVLDVTYSTEVADQRTWPNFTIYFNRRD